MARKNTYPAAAVNGLALFFGENPLFHQQLITKTSQYEVSRDKRNDTGAADLHVGRLVAVSVDLQESG